MEDFEVKHIIDGFISAYAQKDKPIRINFRKLVPDLNNSDRYSHLIHSYPAKLISNIPYFFLKTDYFCPANGVVLDPFCGTGTVMLEANISGRNAKGAIAKRILIPVADMLNYSKVPADLISKFSLEVYSEPVDAAFKALRIK